MQKATEAHIAAPDDHLTTQGFSPLVKRPAGLSVTAVVRERSRSLTRFGKVDTFVVAAAAARTAR